MGETSKCKAISKYLATTKGEKRQQAKAYRSWKFDQYNAARHAEERGYSNTKRKRKQQTILDRRSNNSHVVKRQLRKWAWKELAQQKRVSVPTMKEVALKAEKEKRQATTEWKIIPLHLKARKEKSVPKRSPSIPAHPNQYALLAIKPSVTFAEDEPIQPPALAAKVNEMQPTPYEHIQHKHEQRKAKKMQQKEDNYFLEGAIIAAEDKRTDIAKAEDNLCPFKGAINENDVLQPR